MENNKRLIIADIKSPNFMGKCTGHFFAVAHNYYGLFKENVETLVAGGPVYRQQFKKELLSLPNDVLLCGESKFKNKWKYFQNARSLFHKAIGDTIVIQQGGVITSFLAIAMFYHRQSKLFLIQYSNEGLRSFLGRMLYKLCKSKIDGIICPNDMVGKVYERPYCVVPDYIYLDRKEQIDIPFCEKKYDVCFVGRIEEEKGVLDVARKIAGTKYRMVIAGKVRDSQLGEKLQALNSRCSNIELHLGYVTDEEYYGYIRNSRFCILNYQGEYSRRSSGVVLDTIFNNVPIIGKRCKAFDFIAQFGCGYIYENLEELSLEDILTEQNYERFLNNIALYKQKHVEYAEKLKKFLDV